MRVSGIRLVDLAGSSVFKRVVITECGVAPFIEYKAMYLTCFG